MQRRFKLGDKIASIEQTPSLSFSNDGTQMIFTFPVISTEPPDSESEEPQNSKRHTHRDLFELAGGTVFSNSLKVSLSSVNRDESVLTMSMKVNSKVPGTGAAFAKIVNGSNGNSHHS